MNNWLGQQFGSYLLTDLLGQGGFANVYLGEHVYDGTQAAIKVPRSRSQDKVERFVNEARTLAGLSHPHVVRVLEYGWEGDIPFLAMNYARRGSLQQLFHREGMLFSLGTIVSFVKQVAEGLQYAHDRRLIHRDVKLGNILLGLHNTVWLSDFGIAVTVPRLPLWGHSQGGAGTVEYMSPEQLQGKPEPASDQYALGIVVYELLTGDTPFRCNDPEDVAKQHLYSAPPPLRSRFLEIPPAVERVVLQALAKDPRQRFSCVLEFAAALERASRVPTVEIRRRSTAVDLPVVVSQRRVAIEEPVAIVPQRRVVFEPAPLVLRRRSVVNLPVTDDSRRRVAVEPVPLVLRRR